MACIKEKIKKDKTIAYHFSCCLGRDALGKQICRYSTWYAPKELSPSKARKAAERAAEDWEEQVRAEYEKDLQNPLRASVKEIANGKTNFGEFVMDVWFPICVDNGEHKVRTIAFYNQTAKSVIKNFEGYVLQDMNSLVLQKYFISLKKEKGYSAQYRHHQYRVLKMVFDFAVKQGILLKNPMENVNKPKLERRKVDALSEDEAKEFFAALKTAPLDLRCMLTFDANFARRSDAHSTARADVFATAGFLCNSSDNVSVVSSCACNLKAAELVSVDKNVGKSVFYHKVQKGFRRFGVRPAVFVAV